MNQDATESRTILVVDDDPECRESLSDLLTSEGYGVACAENGSQALEYLTHDTPRVIILDLMMPVMDGREFLKRQKRDPRLRSLPVVFVTGTWRAKGLEGQVVVPKPIDFNVLLGAVRRADGGH
ncbi:MAG: response regulator [Candidatus Binataceae bacterium]